MQAKALFRQSGVLVILGIVTVTTVSCVRSPSPIVVPQVTIEDPSFAPTMEAYTAAPVRWANRVEILLNGEQIFPAQVRAIRSAQKSFTYAQYVFETGPPPGPSSRP